MKGNKFFPDPPEHFRELGPASLGENNKEKTNENDNETN